MRSERPRSAAYRIAFVNFGAYATVLALLGVAVFAVMHSAFTAQLDTMVHEEAKILVREYQSGGRSELFEALQTRQTSSSPTRMMYAIFGPDGLRLAGNFPGLRPSLGTAEVTFRDPVEGLDSARASVVDLGDGERLVVAIDSDWLENVERRIIASFSVAFAVACALGLAGAVVLGSFLKARLSSIRTSADAIIGGDIRQRMPVSARGDEFDQLAITLNRMLDRIEDLLENLRQVSNDIAHDLRTPLARLRNTLERGAGVGSNALIDDALRQVDEVLALFSSILRLAEVESGQTQQYFTTIDVSALTAELAESYAPASDDLGKTLLWSIAPDLRVRGDRNLLAQALVNLLENALRHTRDGAIIRLTAAQAAQFVCIQVSDNGPGIPLSEIDRVTRRFARLERSRNSPGYGLGLSLVRAVAKLHGGQLQLEDANPGLTAVLRLPNVTSGGPSDHDKGTRYSELNDAG